MFQWKLTLDSCWYFQFSFTVISFLLILLILHLWLLLRCRLFIRYALSVADSKAGRIKCYQWCVLNHQSLYDVHHAVGVGICGGFTAGFIFKRLTSRQHFYLVLWWCSHPKIASPRISSVAAHWCFYSLLISFSNSIKLNYLYSRSSRPGALVSFPPPTKPGVLTP